MANFTENNLLYHIFSKSPVSDTTTLGQSLNKSGHTLTTDDIFGEELPAFYDVADEKTRNALSAVNNDICKIGGNFYYYTFDQNGIYSWQSRSAIADGECLFNSSSKYKNDGHDWEAHADEAVVKYHKDKDGEFITEENNGVAGNNFTVRIKKDDGTYIKQFISVTDKIVNSKTSNGYKPVVLQNDVLMEENAKYKDASSDNMRYVTNYYAGIIQFPVQKSETTLESGITVASNIKISVWEYIGKTLTNVLKDFATVESGFNYEVADSCPPASEDLKGWIYFIPSQSPKDSNVYDEFICVGDGKGGWKWEQIGSTAINIEQETHEQWHTNNGLQHIELYTPKSEGSKSTQFSTGALCSGFIFNSPSLIKLSYLRIYGYLKSVLPPSGGSNFDFYVKIIDPKSGHILAVSEKPVARQNNGWDCDADVHFSEENQPLLPKNTDFKVIFSSNNNKNDDTNDRTFQIAFGIQSDYIYSDGKTLLGDNNQQGFFTKQYFTEPHGELKTPPSIITITAGVTQTQVNCIGLHVVPFGKFNKTEEFNDVAYEALKIYQHTNELNQEVIEQNQHHDISHKYDNTNNVKSFNDGIITFSDGTTDKVDVQKAVIAKYLFRGNSISTIEEFNKRDEFDTWKDSEPHRTDFYYEYDVFNTNKYDDDITNGKENLSTLQNVINGKSLFLRSRLTIFNDDLSCLMNGFQMFASSKSLAKFRSALPSLTNGIKMFYGCFALTKFETKLPNLVLAECMFRNNTSLTTINTCLPNLTHAQGMFGGCSNLSTIRFSKNSFGCLYNGQDMFNGCSKIDKFYYELPYLETGDGMFKGCQLDVESVRIIAESLYDFGAKDSDDYAEDRRKHVITIGVGQGVIDKVTEYVELIDSKGWVVELEEYTGDEPVPEPDPEQANYDISEENGSDKHIGGYVKNIGAWHTEIYDKYDLEISRIPYDVSEELGQMWGRDGNAEA